MHFTHEKYRKFGFYFPIEKQNVEWERHRLLSVVRMVVAYRFSDYHVSNNFKNSQITTEEQILFARLFDTEKNVYNFL